MSFINLEKSRNNLVTDTLVFSKLQKRKINEDIFLEKIVIRTSPCQGSCKIYNLEINSNMKCYYQGLRYVDSIGNYEGTIDEKYFNILQEKAKYINYSKLKQRYSSNWTCDQTSSVVLYLKNGNVKNKYALSIYGYEETAIELDIFMNYLHYTEKKLILKRANKIHNFESNVEDKSYLDELIRKI